MADTGDEKEVKLKKAAHTLAREKELAELYEVLSSYGGRAFIWRLLGQCGVYSTASGECKDVFRFEGKRDIGLWVLEELFTAKPDTYTIMRNEAEARDMQMRGKNDG
jgi:hypothetical protein